MHYSGECGLKAKNLLDQCCCTDVIQSPTTNSQPETQQHMSQHHTGPADHGLLTLEPATQKDRGAQDSQCNLHAKESKCTDGLIQMPPASTAAENPG